jgi:hypothetical protein
MFRASTRPSSGAYNCTRNLWFCIRCRLKDVALLVVAGQNIPARPRPTTLHPSTCNVCKTRDWWCSCMLLMMGGTTPEICWATNKRRVKKLGRLLHLVGWFYDKLYEDARVHRREVDIILFYDRKNYDTALQIPCRLNFSSITMRIRIISKVVIIDLNTVF